MTKFALVAVRGDGTTQATNVFANKTELDASVHPDLAAAAIAVTGTGSGGVVAGWILTGDTWAAPPALPEETTAPPRKRVVDRQEFLMLIPASKEATIRAFARGDNAPDPDPFAAARPVVAVILSRVDTAININLDAEANVQAAQFMVQLGLLSQGEADTLLAGPPA